VQTLVDLDALFARHAPRMLDVATAVLRDRGEAEDVVQEVFLRLCSHPGGFDPERGDIGPYLRMVVRSRALDRYRRMRTARVAADRLEASTPPAVEEGPWQAYERAAAAARVREGLRRLPRPQREALVLAHWGGMSADDVARAQHVPLGTAKSRLRLGLRRLREDPDVLAA
jgi:RNA polymerase sigma-70 factor (ECF subfamily)